MRPEASELALRSRTAEAAHSDPRQLGQRSWWTKPAARIALVLLLALLAGEGAGRLLGLHQPVIYEKTTYGYRVVPGQDLFRFGNRSFYNSQGLRSESMSAKPAPGVTRVLCLGDSVTNGGAITDQEDTFPYRLQDALPARLKPEVLNASAPGWAIANELGWLRDNGTFGSGIVVLTLSTHDLFQGIAPSTVVGTHPSFPAQRPVLALQDALQHYVLPRLFGVNTADPGVGGDAAESGQQAALNREDVGAIDDIVRRQGGRLVVLYLEQPEGSSAESQAAKHRMLDMLAARHVPVFTLDAEVARAGRAALFRDDVHPNPAGNRAIAAMLARSLAPLAAQPAQRAGRP